MGWLADPPVVDPMEVFLDWRQSAADTAMCLSTVSEDNRPRARTVLLAGADVNGFHFFTSHRSPKARELTKNQAGAITWYWPPDRQVRVEGTVVMLDADGSQRLWANRPRDAQLQILSFEQSAPVGTRGELELALDETRRRFEGQELLPRPDDWSGFTLVPDRIQFWAQGDDGIPDRHDYSRGVDGWTFERLAP